ncbi:hypothetical protein BDV98DRAFT_576047 [Pterulicium gracile]|uniref:Uncharacterized protein n=1 Tax=Pterulicium gracile TaxID=1884261 RepID=A0A5C3QDI5_9AGAR|nr:hypothetical protein BDV98DRAFT_576047 [Pterula gracilis]
MFPLALFPLRYTPTDCWMILNYFRQLVLLFSHTTLTVKPSTLSYLIPCYYPRNCRPRHFYFDWRHLLLFTPNSLRFFCDAFYDFMIFTVQRLGCKRGGD